MNKTALIFGAGKTGRGFAAHLAFLSGFDIILVDRNRQLVEDLQKSGQYEIEILGNESMNCSIKIAAAYHTDDNAWHTPFVKASLIFTAVFGNNLEALAEDLVIPLKKRYEDNRRQFLTIITCENLTNAAGFLRVEVTRKLGAEKERWLTDWVGFSEGIIFKTCLGPGAGQSPLVIRAQNFFELPYDGENLKEHLPIWGLKPLQNFKDQLRRKIYTYNCINAVITYLGALKGYTQLYEAGNDAEILSIASKAATESCVAQVAEYGFDQKEQDEWMLAALSKFADKNVPDPIDRNAADPLRKLGRDDRLIGPALLAVKHGIYPEGLLAGILACFEYRDPAKNFKVSDLVSEKGADFVLQEVCGLSPAEKLFGLIKENLMKSDANGSK